MRYIIYFLICVSTLFTLQSMQMQTTASASDGIGSKSSLTRNQLDSIADSSPILYTVKNLPNGTTASDIVRWLLNMLGGFLTTIIFYFLHRFFPKIFPAKSLAAWKKANPDAKPPT